MTNNIYWSKSRQKNAQRSITTDNYGVITSTGSFTDKYSEKSKQTSLVPAFLHFARQIGN